jgi:hypothetical protein
MFWKTYLRALHDHPYSVVIREYRQARRNHRELAEAIDTLARHDVIAEKIAAELKAGHKGTS